ncbi:MAG: sigma-70 family RNA polymerase sigma factor [Acidobacteria bacterium]|nr:sigma-70 family RNA polymerase sigma factor [Acidobacteriota bacterium]
MSHKKPQPPDNTNAENLIIELLPLIPGAVRHACHVYMHHPSPDEILDISQSIVLMLVDDNYRRIRSFDHHKSTIETWLQAVVNHYVLRYLQSKKPFANLEDVASDFFAYKASQEAEAMSEERGKLFDEIVKKLTKREMKLFELVCQGMQAEEIAKLLGVKIGTVYRRKHALIKKFQELLEKEHL